MAGGPSRAKKSTEGHGWGRGWYDETVSTAPEKTAPTTVGMVCDFLDQLYPPALAEDWDKNGLICGDRSEAVSKILLAVDPVDEVVDEALQWGADLVITHHPLFLRGTSFVSTDTAKGRVVHRLIRAGAALFNAHTNADSAVGGVAHALAQAAGLDPATCRPLLPAAQDENLGIGRIGYLPEPATVGEIADRLSLTLPPSPGGLYVGGDLEAKVECLAVSGGAGDSLLSTAKSLGAQCFVTADLRHHPASEFLEEGGPALIVPTHWASEWVWLPLLLVELEKWSAATCAGLEVKISQVCSEPWSAYYPTVTEGEPA